MSDIALKKNGIKSLRQSTTGTARTSQSHSAFNSVSLCGVVGVDPGPTSQAEGA